MRRFSQLILIAFVAFGYAGSSAAALGRTSTTDYLVRVEALSYLEKQYEKRAALLNGLKHFDKELAAERAVWEATIQEAEGALANVVKEEQRLLEVMKEAQRINKVNLSEQIKEKEEELANLKKPKGMSGWIVKAGMDYAHSAWSGRTPEQQLEKDLEAQRALATTIATLKISLKDLEVEENLPSLERVMQQNPKLLQQHEEAQHRLDEAQKTIKNLQATAKIIKMQEKVGRLNALIAGINKSSTCMLKLAKCNGWKHLDAIGNEGAVTACKLKSLAKAKKATNQSCKIIKTDSTWEEIDSCIPEYRREILKKPGTEGSRKAFNACREM